MQISTKLFNDQLVRQFGKLTSDVQSLQERIATGKNIISSSDDPVNAVNLSVAKEQRNLLARFETNGAAARRRLDLTDGALNQMINVLTRITELTTQAASGSYGSADREAIKIEIEELSNVMMEIANTKDSQNQSLFGGFKFNGQPFEKDDSGVVTYTGDRGMHRVQISENMNVATSIDGGTSFMRINTRDGRKSVFDVITAVKNAITNTNKFNSIASGSAEAQIKIVADRDPNSWEFNLEGSLGSAKISTKVANNSYTDLVTQINLNTGTTGIVATLDSKTGIINLKDNTNGKISISALQVEGEEFASDNVKNYISFDTLDGAGTLIGETRHVADQDQALNGSIQDLKLSVGHISNQQAFVGAQINKVERQVEVLANRRISVSERVGELGDADLAELVTKLQGLLVSRDAAQQAFAKIGQQSLFDFIR